MKVCQDFLKTFHLRLDRPCSYNVWWNSSTFHLLDRPLLYVYASPDRRKGSSCTPLWFSLSLDLGPHIFFMRVQPSIFYETGVHTDDELYSRYELSAGVRSLETAQECWNGSHNQCIDLLRHAVKSVGDTLSIYCSHMSYMKKCTKLWYELQSYGPLMTNMRDSCFSFLVKIYYFLSLLPLPIPFLLDSPGSRFWKMKQSREKSKTKHCISCLFSGKCKKHSGLCEKIQTIVSPRLRKHKGQQCDVRMACQVSFSGWTRRIQTFLRNCHM